MKIEILTTVVFLSLLHGVIPSHWVPVMALKKQHKWNTLYTFRIVSLLSSAHILSTILIGIGISLLSYLLGSFLIHTVSVKLFSSFVLIVLGFYFIYRHHYHHHFHLYHENQIMQQKTVRKQISALMLGMLLSPCMEITGLYFVGGMLDWKYVVYISFIYFIVSFVSSVFWIFFFDELSRRLNFHQIEHYSGLLSGASLIVSAVLLYFI
ncbi:MAG: hypothetical protein N2203_05230 [Bacteroidia bacterium]|nr:hypothetical protein [Bacteroidia bacterium]